jgi:hypothetical protein
MNKQDRATKLALTKSTLKNMTVRTHLKTGDTGCTDNTRNGSCGSGDSTGGPGRRVQA